MVDWFQTLVQINLTLFYQKNHTQMYTGMGILKITRESSWNPANHILLERGIVNLSEYIRFTRINEEALTVCTDLHGQLWESSEFSDFDTWDPLP